MTNQITLTQSINGLSRNHGLPDLINRFQEVEFLSNPDQVLELRNLSADGNLNIVVPGMGRFSMTDWSKSQIALLLGIKFDKWFENASPDEKAFELNRRFARATGEFKLRTSLIDAGTNGNDGTLQGIVSPGFTPVKDSEIANQVHVALRDVEPELRVIRSDISTRSTSFVIGVGKPFIPGGVNEIGDIFGGIHVQNSGVGYSSLSMTLHLTRLICKNGMTVPLRNAEILRCRHTSGLSLERIQKEIGAKFQEIPGQLRRAGQVLQTARAVSIENIEETITRILQQAHLPRKLVQPLLVAFYREPHSSAFGVAQAMTDAATLAELGMKPEERHQLETAAGNFLQNIIGQQ